MRGRYRHTRKTSGPDEQYGNFKSMFSFSPYSFLPMVEGGWLKMLRKRKFRELENGVISVQVSTSSCMQNKLIRHSHYCFVEQFVYPGVSNLYMANLYLRDEEKWDLISLSLSLSHSLSLICSHRSRPCSFSSQLSSFYSFVLSLAACFEL